jgi:hypothetical protein
MLQIHPFPAPFSSNGGEDVPVRHIAEKVPIRQMPLIEGVAWIGLAVSGNSACTRDPMC